jgi:hypothetical protein
MASIHRQPGRPYWFCAFTEFDPQTNRAKRVFRSTKTSDRKQALEICRAWHKATLLARNGKLSVDAAREVIAQGVADVFTHANVESLPSASIKSWCETWTEAKAIETEESTHARYKLVQPLADYLASLPASDNPNAFIFPGAASPKRTASLSNQFRDILVAAALVEPRPRGHKSTGKGRDQAREASEISFHSLRHSAVTMLKAAGVSDFIAREIVGHESAAVSRQYTHLTTDDKRAAMRRLPDVTNG